MIVGVGFAHRKLLDVLGDQDRSKALRVVKLGPLLPLPVRPRPLARKLPRGSRRRGNRALRRGPHQGDRARRRQRREILGKQSGHLPREGELFRWQIQRGPATVCPGVQLRRANSAEADEASERPRRESHCAGCRYGEILDALQAVAAEIGEEPVLVGDPGCLVTVADRLHAKYAIGSAVGVADGLRKAGLGRRAVALFGDSSFFHTTLPALCNAVIGRSDILMVVLDNGATVTSGFQPNPGVGRDALGRPAPALSIERIASACGVEYVRTIGPDAPPAALHQALADLWPRRDPALIVVEIPPA